jgi:cytochrome b subunit of formate dehydrogenase
VRRDWHETDAIHADAGVVVRHSVLVQLQHWAVALSGIVLLFSGIGQMPVYKRYMLYKVPGFSWTPDFIINFNIHMVAALAFTFVAVFHVVYHYKEGGRSILPRSGDVGESIKIMRAMLTRGQEPPSRKFLAEQRLAYAFIGGTSLLLVITGVVKLFDNLGTVRIGHPVVFWSTMLHNIGTGLFVLGLIAHLGAFLVKANWPLLVSMFTGKVPLAYAEHRHPLWIDEIRAGRANEGKMSHRCGVRLVYGSLIVTGLVMGLWVHPLWFLAVALAAANLVQSAFTHWCPLERLLRRLGP